MFAVVVRRISTLATLGAAVCQASAPGTDLQLAASGPQPANLVMVGIGVALFLMYKRDQRSSTRRARRAGSQTAQS